MPEKDAELIKQSMKNVFKSTDEKEEEKQINFLESKDGLSKNRNLFSQIDESIDKLAKLKQQEKGVDKNVIDYTKENFKVTVHQLYSLIKMTDNLSSFINAQTKSKVPATKPIEESKSQELKDSWNKICLLSEIK